MSWNDYKPGSNATKLGASGAFSGEGHVLMSQGAVKGLLAEADMAEEEKRCSGWEPTLYSVSGPLGTVQVHFEPWWHRHER